MRSLAALQLTALLLAPLAALHAADAPKPKLNPDQFAGIDPDDGTGPRPDKAAPPKLIPNPGSTADYNRAKRTCTGVPSIAVSRGGRLWATWFSGTTPGEIIERCPNAYVVVSTSGDDGKTWKEVLAIDPDGPGPLKAYDPHPWIDPDGKLWVFFTLPYPLHKHAWAITAVDGDQASPAWSQPRPVFEGVLLNKPTVLANGDWLFPTYARRPQNMGAILSHISRDKGRTFAVKGQIEASWDLSPSEPMAVERQDGSLWLLVRTTYGIGESISTDGGKTWPELKPSSILHTPSRFFIRRLASGNLLLVKHGPLDTRTSRSHLTAYVSKDDGKTWGGALMLDERLGVSYPDGQQTPDGLIRIIYDYNRVSDRNILMAAFREEDVAAGKDVSGAVRLRQLVSKATGGQEKPKPSTAPVHANADGKPMRTAQPGTLTSADAKPQPLIPGAKLFTDRAYISAELPASLKNAHFLPVAMNGQKTIKCDRAGTVFFLTPVLERNRDTVAQALMDQGFEKVALPEVPLFNPGSTANFCTLFQKDCAPEETILIGKWAVPVFFP